MKIDKNIKEFIYQNHAGISSRRLAQMINDKFGPSLSLRQIEYFRRNHHLPSGIDTRFQKGHQSFNKGKKMTPEMYQKAKATMFKKGHKPKNTRAIKSEQIRDGAIWIKVNDNPGQHNLAHRWKPRARVVYETAHGAIDDHNVIIHLDGNILNDDLENLAIASRKELLVMNQKKLFFEDRELTKQGQMISKNIVKIFEREKELRK